jgi:hypothetical protein
VKTNDQKITTNAAGSEVIVVGTIDIKLIEEHPRVRAKSTSVLGNINVHKEGLRRTSDWIQEQMKGAAIV